MTGTKHLGNSRTTMQAKEEQVKIQKSLDSNHKNSFYLNSNPRPLTLVEIKPSQDPKQLGNLQYFLISTPMTAPQED